VNRAELSSILILVAVVLAQGERASAEQLAQPSLRLLTEPALVVTPGRAKLGSVDIGDPDLHAIKAERVSIDNACRFAGGAEGEVTFDALIVGRSASEDSRHLSFKEAPPLPANRRNDPDTEHRDDGVSTSLLPTPSMWAEYRSSKLHDVGLPDEFATLARSS